MNVKIIRKRKMFPKISLRNVVNRLLADGYHFSCNGFVLIIFLDNGKCFEFAVDDRLMLNHTKINKFFRDNRNSHIWR